MENQMRRHNASFTPWHKLEDAEKEYANAIYRLRKAENEESNDYTSAKIEMLRLEAKVATIRSYIYSGKGYKLFERTQKSINFKICPKPAWGS